MFVEVQTLQGLCYIVIPYSTKNKSSMSMSNRQFYTVQWFQDIGIIQVGDTGPWGPIVWLLMTSIESEWKLQEWYQWYKSPHC